MRQVPKPSITARISYRTCVSNVSDADKRARYIASSTEIDRAETRYLAAGKNGELHLSRESDYNLPTVTTKEMIWLYDRKLVDKKSPGREVYDAVKLSARDGMCALCGAQAVSSLDHYLPKTKFPALAVTPANLLPVCSRCNHMKGSKFTGSIEELALNPYFDDFGDDVWLTARVEHKSPGVAVFVPDPPSHWDPAYTSRIVKHFESLNLQEIYGSCASQEIQGIQYGMKMLFEAAGEAAVREELTRRSATWHNFDANSWQAALFTALSADDWYCCGGFIR